MGRSLSFFVKLGWSWEGFVGCYNNSENSIIIAYYLCTRLQILDISEKRYTSIFNFAILRVINLRKRGGLL